MNDADVLEILENITDFNELLGISKNLLKEHAELSKHASAYRDENKNLHEQNAKLNFKLYKHTKGRFGVSSEKFREEFIKTGEPDIFDELDDSQGELEGENELVTIPEHTRKKKQKVIPDDLPIKRVEYDILESEKTCTCGCTLTKIGEDTYRQIEYIPATSTIIENVKFKYACKGCEETIITASMPLQPIPKSIATAGTLAAIIVSKYKYHLPLYRQEMIWKSQNINLPRNLMSSWMIKVGVLIEVLVDMLKHMLLTQNNYIQADETTCQVMNEKDKKNSSKSYIWVYKTGVDENGIAIYEYQPSRKKEHPNDFLKGFSGYLQTDGYAGYDKASDREDIVKLECLAHARRKFFDIFKSSKNNKGSVSDKALNFIGKLYKIEKQIKDLSYNEKKEYRQNKSKPVFKRMYKWLKDIYLKCPPKSSLGTAIKYTLDREKELGEYLNDGILNIDNNLCENKIRPFAVGRKNWLFMGSVSGAKSSCAIYSLLVTAEMSGHDPYDYFKYILEKIPICKTKEDLGGLLPMNLKPEETLPFDSVLALK